MLIRTTLSFLTINLGPYASRLTSCFRKLPSRSLQCPTFFIRATSNQRALADWPEGLLRNNTYSANATLSSSVRAETPRFP